MVGNPINYDDKYVSGTPIWGNPKLDFYLKRYISLLGGKKVLDLGIGEGKNSVFLANNGYSVTGVDISQKALEICKRYCSSIDFVHCDIRNYQIEKNHFDLIMSNSVLHFLHKDDVCAIVQNIKAGLVQNGLVYISVFSVDDPGFSVKENSEDFCKLDNGIFYRELDDTYYSYFSKAEVLKLFSDFSTIFVSDEFGLDLSHGRPHFHGVIRYIGRKR